METGRPSLEPQRGAIKVLIVDDSPFMRKAIERMLTADDIQVVGMARDGQEALEKIPQLQPDIITLDVEMPRMDGLTCLRHIMQSFPRPVLMVSSLTQEGAQATLDALAAGALDFIPKESSVATGSILQIQQELQEKVRKLSRSPKFRKAPGTTPAAGPRVPLVGAPTSARPLATGSRPLQPVSELLAIGCSTGGPKALQDLLPAIPKGLPVPCLIVQHMPGTFTKAFADRLDGLCQVKVKEAEQGEMLRPGTVYIAPGGIHMLYKNRNGQQSVELSAEPSNSLHRPSVDVMFQSVFQECSRQVLAMILTGMGSDGAKGMEALKQKGAHTVAEAEESCVVYGMPRAAVERGCVDLVLPIQDMAQMIRQHYGI